LAKPSPAERTHVLPSKLKAQEKKAQPENDSVENKHAFPNYGDAT
jgi:hypothetical protein